MYPPQLCW